MLDAQWHPTPVLLPGTSRGRRALVGCSPWGRTESDMTERLGSSSGSSGKERGKENSAGVKDRGVSVIRQVTGEEGLEEAAGLVGDVSLGAFCVEEVDKAFRNSQLTEEEVQK